MFLINPPASDGVEMVREGRCMQRRSAWGAVWPPISLATIASVLESNGYECRIRDCIVEKVSLQGLLKEAQEFHPEMMIVNTATGSIKSDLDTVNQLKKVARGSKIFVIGIHPTALPEETLDSCRGLDAVIRGEPEAVALSLANAIRYNKNWKDAPGISYKEGLLFYKNPSPEPLELDSLPFPAWHLIKTEQYRMPILNKPFLMIGTSRGCPFNCEFCADATYYGKKLRTKTPAKIVRELDWVKTKFGIQEFLFWAESSTIKTEWTIAVCDAIISAGLNIRFVINSRPDNVNLELLKKLRQAGCWMIGYGLESGSEQMLKLMGKNIKLADNKNAVRWAKEADLLVTGHFVLGFPGETRETAQETIKFALEEPVDFAQFYCAVPFPGSKLYEEAKKHGWIINNDWTMFEQNFCVLSTQQLSAEELIKIRADAYRSFYYSPKKMLNFIKIGLKMGGLKNLFSLSREFQGWMAQ